ncbi:MAG: C39 family peptidase, partial [Patescibacteria group bacterium]
MKAKMKIFGMAALILGLMIFSNVTWAKEILLPVEHTPQVDVPNGIGLYKKIQNANGEWVYQTDSYGNKIPDWGPTKICGPVSLVIATSYLYGESPSSQKVKDLVDWMAEKKIYPNINNYYGYDTNYGNLEDILEKYYRIYNSKWFSNWTNSQEKIVYSLRSNKPVIVGDYTNMIYHRDHGHFMVITGLRDTNYDGDFFDDNDEVHVVDPGHSQASGSHLKWYKISELRNAWQGILIVDYEEIIAMYDFTNLDNNSFDPQGWTTGYDTEPWTDPSEAGAFAVHVTGPNPGIISPELPAGIMAKDTIITFSARVIGNDSPVKAELYIMHKDGSWTNKVYIGEFPASDLYRAFMVNLSLVECYDPNSNITPDILEVKKFSLELSEGGNGNDEYWNIDWVKVGKGSNNTYNIGIGDDPGGGGDSELDPNPVPNPGISCNKEIGFTPEGFTRVDQVCYRQPFYNNYPIRETAM